MTVYKRIEEDRKDFANDRALLSLLLSEICVDGKPMDDKAAVARLVQMRKVASRNVVLYAATNPAEATKESNFIKLIDDYLPYSVTAKEIINVLENLDLPYEMKSMGPLMKALKENFEIVDGNLVKQILTQQVTST